MPDKTVEIPGIGDVDFPESMTDDQISAAIRRSLHEEGPVGQTAEGRPVYSTTVTPGPRVPGMERFGGYAPPPARPPALPDLDELERRQAYQNFDVPRDRWTLDAIPIEAGLAFNRGLSRLTDPLENLTANIGRTQLAGMGQPQSGAPAPVDTRAIAGGTHDILSGGFELAKPFIAANAIEAPIAAAKVLLPGMAAQAGITGGLKALGLPEEYADLTGDMGALLTAAAANKLSPEQVVAARNMVLAKARAAGRFTADVAGGTWEGIRQKGTGPSGATGPVEDLLGVVSPRAAHGLRTVERAATKGSQIVDAINARLALTRSKAAAAAQRAEGRTPREAPPIEPTPVEEQPIQGPIPQPVLESGRQVGGYRSTEDEVTAPPAPRTPAWAGEQAPLEPTPLEEQPIQGPIPRPVLRSGREVGGYRGEPPPEAEAPVPPEPAAPEPAPTEPAPTEPTYSINDLVEAARNIAQRRTAQAAGPEVAQEPAAAPTPAAAPAAAAPTAPPTVEELSRQINESLGVTNEPPPPPKPTRDFTGERRDAKIDAYGDMLRAAGKDSAYVDHNLENDRLWNALAKASDAPLDAKGKPFGPLSPVSRTQLRDRMRELEQQEQAAPAETSAAATAPTPAAAVNGAPPRFEDVHQNARSLLDAGVTADDVNRFDPAQLESLGIPPNQVQPVIDRMRRLEGAQTQAAALQQAMSEVSAPKDLFSNPDGVAAAAEARIAKRGSIRKATRGNFLTEEEGSQPSAEDLADMVEWGAAKIVKGVNDFNAWSRQLYDRFGPRFGGMTRDDVQSLWTQARMMHADQQSGSEVSTRLPSAVKATEDPMANMLTTGMESWSSQPEQFAKNAAALKTYPNFRDIRSVVPQRIVDTVLDRVVQNLLHLHDAMPEAIRQRARLWYDGANKLAHDFSGKYGTTPEQSAGVLAVLSPQKDWFMNVDLAKRILNVWRDRDTINWDPRMEQKWEDKIGANFKDNSIREQTWNAINGKDLRDITDPGERAVWLRLHDEATNSRSYKNVSPEGKFGGPVLTKKNEPADAAWGDYNTIRKALAILEDGSRENISANLGNEHKVRNFYNNIINPNSRAGHVTIDTHAVAAALMRALSGQSLEVEQNFGGRGASSSSFTGESGTYGLYAEAYRRAAAERGLLPREMQSITWEAVRGLFAREFKTSMQPVVNRIWRDVSSGKMTRGQAIERIWDITKGIQDPAWFRSDSGAAQAAPR